jgi:formamidopyrimidine-DNA glycosylase
VPELPEVETVVRDLRPLLVGRRFRAVAQQSKKALRKPWQTQWNPLLISQRVVSVERRGKWIVLTLEGDRHLVFHLGMTGQLTAVPGEAELLPHTHLVFDLEEPENGTNGSAMQLRFRDIRRFGSATLFDSRAALDVFFAETGLGPEPFDLDPRDFCQRLASIKRPVKAMLLDQQVVAGVGNIYADEALFEARLHPTWRACDLDRTEANRLRKAIATVLRRAINRRGSTIRNYVGGSGLEGKYQNEFRAYGRVGEPCRRCGTAIESMRLAGRSTYFCPHCQQAEESPRNTRKTRKKTKEEQMTDQRSQKTEKRREGR